MNSEKEIKYQIGIIPDSAQIIAVYNSSGITRPTHDAERIQKMYLNSNLVISAWIEEELIGISRALTDFCYACYLSDLAVKKEFQALGVGKKLIQLTQNQIGEQTALLLLAAPSAMTYYPKIGFEKIENGFIVKRKK